MHAAPHCSMSLHFRGYGDCCAFPAASASTRMAGRPIFMITSSLLASWLRGTRSFSKQWPKFNRRVSTSERLRLAACLTGVGAGAAFVLRATEISAVAAVAAIFIGISAYIANRIAQRIRCEPPPGEPRPDGRALSAKPTVVFDSHCISIGGSQFDRYAGYPPDWRQRQEFCRRRDGCRCRICGSCDSLHVHHVWPVSFSANHTAQNLITLCRQCHMGQDYWEHRRLVAANIRANQRYSVRDYVRGDGVRVKGHRRRKGRRGKFWKGIKRQRLQNGGQP